MSKIHKQSGFGAVGVLAVVAIIALVGFSGWLVYDRQQNQSDNSDTNTSKTEDKINTSETDQTTTTIYSQLPNTHTTVTLKHPKGWVVSNKTVDYDANAKATQAYIMSDKGNYLHIRDSGGVGGACEPNNGKFTLEKRLPTQSSNYFFAEYSYEGGSKRYLSIENHKNHEPWTTMKEGDTQTDTCENMPTYTFAGELYISLSKSSTSSIVSEIPYTELKEDPEFIAMLQSLTVSE